MSIGRIRNLFLVTVLFLVSLLEIFCGNFGVVLPLTPALLVYLTLVYGWQTGLAAALATGVWMDLVYGRSFPVLIPAFFMLVAVAWSGRRRGVVELPDVILPALGAIGVYEGVLLIAGLAGDGTAAVWELILQGVWQTALGGVMVFFLSYFLDKLADRLGLPQCVPEHGTALRVRAERRRRQPGGRS